MFLGSYPIIELTRLILISGTFYFPGMQGWFAVEIATMWLFYVSIIPVYLLFTRPGFSLFRKKLGGGNVKR